jgi:PadR family transcriptional regulator PadR
MTPRRRDDGGEVPYTETRQEVNDGSTRLVPVPGVGAFEQAVLLAIVRLRDEAYGRAILNEVQIRLGRDVAAGAVHATLERLEHKGLVTSRLGSGTPIRAGRCSSSPAIVTTSLATSSRSTPTVDFHARSMVPTCVGIGIVFSAGFAATQRSGLVAAGTVGGVATTVIATAVSIIGAAVLLAIWHDAGTMAAIRGSGGLAEVFTLPITMVVPGAVLGTVGGVAGAIFRRLRAA